MVAKYLRNWPGLNAAQDGVSCGGGDRKQESFAALFARPAAFSRNDARGLSRLPDDEPDAPVGDRLL